MRYLTIILLLMFGLFLTTPTLISLSKLKVDTSYFYNTSEESETETETFEELFEEESKWNVSNHIIKLDYTIYDSKFHNFEYSSSWYKLISTSIVLPPPELS